MIRLSCFAATVLIACSVLAAEIRLERTQGGVAVKIDGQLFTEYLTRSGTKPILWPIVGPTGKSVTRAWPMEESQPGEKKDHLHHRSLWFTHGSVGGVSFWEEKKDKAAIIEHREFVKVQEQPVPTIVTRNEWIAPDGIKVCEDERTLRFGVDGDARWIDFDIEIKAKDRAVRFGDTKEGTLGVRVAEDIRVDAKKGGKIVNSAGNLDKDAWAKRAEWVDYHGPLDGQVVGIAIMNHPTSFRYPTYWHVRTYGLFAANPFGVRDFGGSASGEHEIAPGKSIVLRYRVYLHRGDEKTGKVAEAFGRYRRAIE